MTATQDPPARTGPAAVEVGWRAWVPSQWALICILVAIGLAVCAYAQNLSRETLLPNPWIYWAGIALIVTSTAYGAMAPGVGSLERMLLVALESLGVCLARAMHDPYGFTFTDDFAHALSLEHIESTHHLFHGDLLLPVAAHYPGLEAATSALAFLSHMSPFGSGVLMVATCRIALMLGLYVLFTGVSRSARVGALAALLFSGNSNFMYFEGQFAYETLSLPLLALTLGAIAERQRSVREFDARAWGWVVVLGILAVVPTHHLTSYTMCLVLWLLCLRRVSLPRWLGGRRELPHTAPVWPFALFATTLVLAWLFVVASQTVGYVTPDIVHAFKSAFQTVLGTSKARALFSGGAAGPGTQNLVSEEAVSFLEPVLLLVVGAIGVWRVWRRAWIEPIVIVFTAMAILYFVLTGLRVVPSAWEVGNRGAEYMFLGMSFMVGAATLWRQRIWERRPLRLLVAIGCAAAVIGAAVAGAAANIRLAHPTQFTASDHRRVLSETLAVAAWFSHQPPGIVLTDDAEADAISVYAHHTAIAGTLSNADYLLSSPNANAYELSAARQIKVRWVVVDMRRRSQDPLTGLYLNVIPPAAPVDLTFPRSILHTWSRAGALVYDSGNVKVFDLSQRP